MVDYNMNYIINYGMTETICDELILTTKLRRKPFDMLRMIHYARSVKLLVKKIPQANTLSYKYKVYT